MIRYLLPLLMLVSPAALAQTTPIDGEWSGRSDGGSCNAPLDYAISVESGIVDGTSFDTTAKGPVPNTKKSAPPAPTPGLWQIHGIAKQGGFTLMALASVKGTERRSGRLEVTVQGDRMTVRESSGCGRTATLSRAR
jgi:hypothetical protein